MDRQNLGSQHLIKTGKQSNFLMQLCIGGSDGIVLMVFITILLDRSALSRPPMIMFSLAIMLLAGLIMGVSGYLASLIEKKHFKTVREPIAQLEEIRKEKRLLDNLEIPKKLQLLAFEEMEKDRQHWAGLMGVATPEVPTAANPSFTNGVHTGFSYIVGGMLPLLPYLLSDTGPLWWASVVISIIGLSIFGYFKSFYKQTKPLESVMGSLLAGTMAGFGAYALSKIFVFTL